MKDTLWGSGSEKGGVVNYEWAFIANWLIFGGLTLLYVDPFDLFGSKDDDDDDNVDPNPDEGIRFSGDDTDETIEGTEGNDLILGLGGKDEIQGGGGHDFLEGNTGDDSVFGGAGDDSIAGGAGTDQLFGGAGNDVISVDRLDGDAEWDRGDQETLSGEDGDDQLYFSGDDIATGGAGSDSFNMIFTPEDGPAHITDFEPSEDKLTFFTDFDPENPPEITVASDEDAQTTSIMIGDQETLKMDGVFSRDELDIELKEAKDLDPGNPATI
ncbi:MAG: type I secretion protein [Paracoccus sp. (in: a-proteobacteria)]|nr:type I secretion protein [Paracoccus sp. (in: a-proteobacteria)]